MSNADNFFLSQWIAFSKVHLEKELSYDLLIKKLELLDQVWNSSSPSREEVITEIILLLEK